MSGWIADFFRLAWGLWYWNARKSWFRFRRGRAGCPCQSPSDSGRALETHCEASLSWHKQARFKRVCPLLVNTKDGLRCSAHAADVRPFWGQPLRYYGGTFAALYLSAVLGLFVFLRVIGYPISIVHLAWPGSWHRVGQVRGWFFFERANQAFAAGRTPEGMLYLTNAYQFDPTNDRVALLLAQKVQLNQPGRADAIYRRLLLDHPEQRQSTAQFWFRSLLARGEYTTIQELALTEVVHDADNGAVWLRALLFASRQLGTDTAIRAALGSTAPELQRWQRVLQVELLLRTGRTADARRELNRPWPDAPAFACFYQVDALIRLGDAFAAVDRLESYGRKLDDLARATLHLNAYRALDAGRPIVRLVDALLAQPLNSATVGLLSAFVIRHPDPLVLDRLYDRLLRPETKLTAETLPLYLAVASGAGVAKDWAKFQTIAGLIKRDAGGSSFTLGVAESFFRGETPQSRIAGLISVLPMPLETHYALLERYPGPARPPAKPASTAPQP